MILPLLLRASLACAVAVTIGACAHETGPAPASAASTGSAPSALPEGAPRAPLAWADFSPATFAKAKAERKFIVLDGSAEWCHWCHVMEASDSSR